MREDPTAAQTESASKGILDQSVDKCVFLVRDSARGTQSYAWRIWSGGASFYIKPRYRPVGGFKVSLHGPREPHEKSFWKVAIDRRDRAAAARGGGVALHAEEEYLHRFLGRRVASGVRHVVRIRNPWNTFHRGSPSGPHPGNVKNADIPTSFHAVLPAPEQMKYVDVDIYVSDTGRPYWPRERDLIRDCAKVGWLTNQAGQHLTAVSWQHGFDLPSPAGLGVLPRPDDSSDALRVVGAYVDRDLLWVQEQVGSRRFFDGHSYTIDWGLS